jgi:citrate lyase subunit beta/citryl-CoA lyase
MQTKLMRSWMFVPGNRQRMVDKALGLPNVDAIMLDVEDGVPVQEKENARRLVGASLAAVGPGRKGPARYVRINSVGHQWMHADLAAVIQAGTEGLAVPKVESVEQVKLVSAILDERERQAKLPAGKVRLLIAVESPRGLLDAPAIAAASPRVVGLMFGAEDLGKELGLPLRREGEAAQLLFQRSMLVMAAAAANVLSVDGVWPDIHDAEGLKRHAIQSRRLGFTGMSLIHPGQIDMINEAFTPTEEDVAYCRKVIQAFDEAQARGEGSIAFGGQLIDLPIVERARRTVAFASELAARKAV